MIGIRRSPRRRRSTSDEGSWLLLAAIAVFVVMLGISLLPLLSG